MAKIAKPVLVRVGRSLVEPGDVAAVTKVRRDLYVIRLKSQPNAEYPIWAHEKDLTTLLEHFEIISSDGDDDDED